MSTVFCLYIFHFFIYLSINLSKKEIVAQYIWGKIELQNKLIFSENYKIKKYKKLFCFCSLTAVQKVFFNERMATERCSMTLEIFILFHNKKHW